MIAVGLGLCVWEMVSHTVQWRMHRRVDKDIQEAAMACAIALPLASSSCPHRAFLA